MTSTQTPIKVELDLNDIEVQTTYMILYLKDLSIEQKKWDSSTYITQHLKLDYFQKMRD